MKKTPGQRGSITLVALCFVTVMAIGLASYLAISGQSMKLSNRSYAKDVSKQLAEKGLEVALLALKTNNWDDWSANSTSADWTLSGTTATCTITYPSGSYGTSGMTATTKIRVDNYNAYNQAATWSSSTSYKLNDVVSYSGMWYTCVQANTNQTPTATGNLAYWVPAPIPWKWGSDITYAVYDIVNYNGVWYRRILTTVPTQTPLNTATGSASSNWVTIPKDVTTWSSSTNYTTPTVVNHNGVNYRCIQNNINQAPPNSTYWTSDVNGISLSWRTDTYYTKGAIVYQSSTNKWFYCDNDHTTQGVADFATDQAANANNWKETTAAADYTGYLSWRWVTPNTGLFEFNDTIYYSGNWYRYISTLATSNATTPPTSARWDLALDDSWNHSTSDTYNIGDVVYHSGSFYRCTRAHSNQTPPNTTYWSPDPLKSNDWDIGKSYNQNDVVRYRGNWYRNLTGSNSNPASSNDWAIAPRSISTWDSAKVYSIDDFVSHTSSGTTTWYRCILGHTNQAVTNTTYWSPITGADYAWTASPASAYTNTSYVSYGGVWYDCHTAPTANQSPNNTSFWTALGAPVIYAEGNASIPLQVTTAGAQQFATISTQIRATASPAALFPNATGTTGITTIGGAGTVASYDSETDSSPDNPPAELGYAATLASTYASGTAISGGTGTIQGYLAAPSATTSPYAPQHSFGGTLKGTSAGTGIDLTRISRSPYVPQFSINPVPGGTPFSTVSNLKLGTPGAPTPSVYYYNNTVDLDMNSAAENITINGPVVLYVPATLQLRIRSSSSAKITINSTGSLRLVVDRDFRVDSTGGGIVNNTYDPKNLTIQLTRSGTDTFNYSEPHAFYGTIYLPDSSSTFTIASGVTVLGALSMQTLTFSGAADVYYDTSLRYTTFQGIDTPFQLDQWRELTDTTERANW